jgi:predicted ATPase/class 3 adenylate cyclase
VRDLPSGTLTFLFTDVEGSTQLLRELGAEAYADALAEHRRVIRDACARQAGVEVDTQGDAFFFAFPTAPGAIGAAAKMIEALAAGEVRVRVGLHTGTPLLTDEGYVGDDVHLAARVAASGHGGQVLVSYSTAALIEPSGSEPQALSLVDLGEHRLKDIEGAVSIFQLGDGSFPPLKTISNTNLPRPASSFVGREAELAEVLSRMETGARLLTLTGPGGTGKTRLAIEAAASLVAEYKAGVFWVGLAALRDPALVSETISQTLGAKDSLAEHIGERELLLLLDNVEQVIECAPELSSLLQSCCNLTLLVTSRELLRVQGEVEYAVPPLAESEAVSLFCERAQVEPSREIAELCARLDSLPLAVELAAARAKALSPAQILDRLSQRLDLLKGGRDSDPRQQTLRATIEWSYDLLSPAEQQLFARLSVFAGGCTLEAAEEVCDADLDTLQSLVEKSLLRFMNERYWMLETIREYAADLVEGGIESAGRDRHAAWYLALVEEARHDMDDRSRHDAVTRVESELANVRNSLSWFREAARPSEELRMLRELSKFWLSRDHLAEGEVLLAEALARIADDESELRLRVELALGEIEMRRGNPREARPSVERWLEWARGEDDVSEVAYALSSLASISMREADFTTSVALLEEALEIARPLKNGKLRAYIAGNLGYALSGVGRHEQAAALCRESLDLAPTAADACVDRANLGLALLGLRDIEGASRQYRLALEQSLESGFFFAVADALVGAAVVAFEQGRSRAALGILASVETLRSELGLSAEPLEQEMSLKTLDSARSMLDVGEAQQAWLAGSQLTADEAVEYALVSID